MRLEDIYSNSSINKKPVISFEVFPPKEDIENRNRLIIDELEKLTPFFPELISITYGAGGTTKVNSLELTKLIKNELKVEVMPHFTCKNSTKEFIQNYLSEIEEECIENVLALRGDVPRGEELTCSDFCYANELVDFVSSKTKLAVAVAGYPEGHLEADNIDADILNLKKKVDAGAKVIYTQLFFDNSHFYSYVDKVRSVGIDVPIVPGILPITSYKQLSRMISLCGVKVPDTLLSELEKYQNDKNAVKEIGINYAISQTQRLIDYGVAGMHFYILNKSEPTFEILENVL